MITRLPSADVLANLKSLQTLSLTDCWALTSLGGIGSLPCLTDLILSGCPCLDSETAFLSSSLQSIHFQSCAVVDVILANADLPRLSELWIDQCHMRTASLQFGNLRSLHSLSIWDCSGVSSLVDLQELRSLEFLFLRNCSKLQSVTNLPGSLKSFVIHGCPLLEEGSVNTDPISGVHNSWALASGDGKKKGFINGSTPAPTPEVPEQAELSVMDRLQAQVAALTNVVQCQETRFERFQELLERQAAAAAATVTDGRDVPAPSTRVPEPAQAMPVVESIGVAAEVWVASPLVAKLLNEGFDSLGIDAEKRLEEMEQNILPVLKSVIEKAEGSRHHRKVEGWLQRLKDAYDDAEDALDLLHYDRLRRQVATASSSSTRRRSNPVPKVVRDMLSPQKIKLKRRLNELEMIASEAEKLRALLRAWPDQTAAAAAPDSRPAISVPPLRVFGRDEDREEIIQLLKMEPAAEVMEKLEDSAQWSEVESGLQSTEDVLTSSTTGGSNARRQRRRRR
uniref:Disease resistance N-terminal domain-containing protein n=1 Tax=Ananas comosus var. bracteatus TaxID=296719 RepID=A0A6V7QIQ3_ANACO|nr:unnamed protein product [Ananas comosus var. bracteatus]